MHTAQIKKVTKEVLQADNTNFLDITVEIVNDKDKVVAVRKLGFPFDTPEKEIKAEIKATVKQYEAELENAEREKLKAEAEENANKVVENLEGQVI